MQVGSARKFISGSPQKRTQIQLRGASVVAAIHALLTTNHSVWVHEKARSRSSRTDCSAGRFRLCRNRQRQRQSSSRRSSTAASSYQQGLILPLRLNQRAWLANRSALPANKSETAPPQSAKDCEPSAAHAWRHSDQDVTRLGPAPASKSHWQKPGPRQARPASAPRWPPGSQRVRQQRSLPRPPLRRLDPAARPAHAPRPAHRFLKWAIT
jgi:hypothetical protein